MRKALFVVSLVCMVFNATALTRAEKQQQIKENERKELQTSLETIRDSLQILIAQQYAFKQQVVEEREVNKEELDRLTEQQGRLENDRARIKEERLSREQTLTDERKKLELKQEEWAYLRTHLSEVFQKESDGILEVFPLDRELRRAGIEDVRAIIGKTGSPASSLIAYIDYRLKWFIVGDSVVFTQAVVAPEEGAPLPLSIARFGNVFGYGLDTATGDCYYLRQTGRLGAERFAADKIAALEIAAQIKEYLPLWVQNRKVSGNVPMEVMQNDQARMLISGKKESSWETLYESLSKGGWVMVPMLLLPFWVLFLMGGKIIQYSSRGGRLRRQFKGAMRFLEKKDYDGALAFVTKKKKLGFIGGVVQACIERRTQGRDAGERVAYELMTLETPQLSSNLNTLAVIAGAAPLLGLLGTISGMITLFAAVTQFGTGDPKFLAGGISEALITAKTGLAIAIPVLFIHDLLRGAKDRLIANMEKNAIAILNVVYPEE
jgi:biopolymer transport protein ExbB